MFKTNNCRRSFGGCFGKMNKRWDKQKIIEEFNLFKMYNEINLDNIKKMDTSLYKAATRHFGSYKNFIISQGIDYLSVCKTKPKGFWSKSVLINEFKKYEHRGIPWIRKNRSDLRGAILYHYGSMKCFIETGLGEDYIEYYLQKYKRRPTYWNKKTVQKEFKKLINSDSILNIDYLFKKHSGFIHAVQIHFGSYELFLQKQGFDYGSIKYRSIGEQKLFTILDGMETLNYDKPLDNKVWIFKNGKVIRLKGSTKYRKDCFQLDRFYPKLSIAFEFDGEQHFKRMPFFYREKGSFRHRKIKDEQKEKACRLAEVKLVRIRFDEQLTDKVISDKLVMADV